MVLRVHMVIVPLDPVPLLRLGLLVRPRQLRVFLVVVVAHLGVLLELVALLGRDHDHGVQNILACGVLVGSRLSTMGGWSKEEEVWT